MNEIRNSWRPVQYWIKQEVDEKEYQNENVDDYRQDVLRTIHGAHIEVY